MKTIFGFQRVFAIALCLTAGIVVQVRAQSERPPCLNDGSMPPGVNECECQQSPTYYHGQYTDSQRDYQVHLPDNVAAIVEGCSRGHTFSIGLEHPESGKQGGGFPWNQVWVTSAESPRKSLQTYADRFVRSQEKDARRTQATDLQFDEPAEISLSSLHAIYVRSTRTEPGHGKLVTEDIVANSPQKDIVYMLSMTSPADLYEKNRKLFEAITEGFRYTPAAVETH